MRKLTTLLTAASLCISSVAAADDPQTPLISSTPMSPDPSGVSAAGSQPSDLPAPESRSWVNRPLLVTSSIVLVGSYVPAATAAYTSERNADQTNLYYPIVGPWMNLADRQCDVQACTNETLNKALLVASGVGQGLGAIGVVTSFFLPNKATRNWYLIGNDSVHVAPARVGITGYGVGAVGNF